MVDSVRAFQNDGIGAQEGSFRSFTGDFYRSKNFRKVSMGFWMLVPPDVTNLLNVAGGPALPAGLARGSSVLV